MALADVTTLAETFVTEEAIAKEHASPGVIVLTPSLQLLYINHEAQELTRRLHLAHNETHMKGLLPVEVMSLCEDIVTLLRNRTHPKDWEQAQLTRIAGATKCPVLLRGFGIPQRRSLQEGRILILIEALSDQQEKTRMQVQERYHLTEREQSVIIYLLQGLTNKEIADRLVLSEYTVKDHLKRIMHKTKTTTRAGVLARILLALSTKNNETATSERKSES